MFPLLAPILAQLAGAGMQKVADMVLDKGLDVVEDKLGITLTPNADGILDTDKLQSVKEAAMKHEEFKIEADAKDRDSARAAHVAIATSKDVHILEKLTMPVMALGTVFLAFMLITVLMFKDVPPDQQQIVIFALGFITSSAGQVLSFFFGSSQGSKDKTEALNGLKR